MPVSFPLIGLAANDPVPGVYIQIDFAQGEPSNATTTYGALLIGNKLSTGDAVVDTTVYGPFGNSPLPLANEQDAINRFGQGSELHRMWRRFVAKNPNTPVFAIAVTESGGAKATLAITVATAATGNATARYYQGDEFVDTPITSGDTAIQIATNVCASINTQANWAVTAANSGTAIVTVSAKQKGPRGNWLRGALLILAPQGSIGTTSSVTVQTFFTGGTTADSNTTALANILAKRFYYIVSAAEDQTQLVALSSQVNTQALPTTGIRQTIVAASVDTEGNAQTIAIALNQARAELVWMQNSDWPPCELAADLCALYSLGEVPDGAGGPSLHNFDGLGTGSRAVDNLWTVPFPRSGTVPTRATIAGALNNGLSPISANALGQTYLVMRATTRSLTGGLNDYRIRDPHKVRICDFYGDVLQAKLIDQYGGKDIIPNPVVGQRISNNNVVWPAMIEASTDKLTDEFGEDGQLQDVANIKAKTQAIQEGSPKTRASVRVPLETIDVLHQIGVDILQVA